MSTAPYNDGGYADGEQMNKDKDKWFPLGSRSKAGIQNYKSVSKLPLYGITGFSPASANREHWIKTDADCKYCAIPQNDKPQDKYFA